MLLDISVTVQNKTTTYGGGEGMPTEIWTASQTTERANKQPLSGEIAYQEYGISDAGITNVFFLEASTAAVENGRIIHDSNTYYICRIEEYDDHHEAIVRPVME